MTLVHFLNGPTRAAKLATARIPVRDEVPHFRLFYNSTGHHMQLIDVSH